VTRARWFAAFLLSLGFLSFASAQAQQQPAESPAFLKIIVPTADTKLEVDGLATKKTGLSRDFITPALVPGKRYGYNVKATFTQNGKEVVKEKEVVVEAGKEITVDFTEGKKEEPKKGEDPKKEMKKEEAKKEEAKKEEPKKKEEAKKEVKKEEAKKEEAKKKDAPKKEEPKKATVEKKEAPKTIVVPYVPTPQTVVDKMLELAAVKEGDVVYDLGCGDGRIVITAVKQFKAKKGYGVDLNPERVKDSNENAKKEGVVEKVKFEQGDVLQIKDLSEANVVTLYLLPEVNKRLIPVLKSTLKPGARIVSHDFDMGDWKPEKEIEVKESGGRLHTLYLWTIPGDKKEDKKEELKKEVKKDEAKESEPKKEVKKEAPKKDEIKKEEPKKEASKTIVVPYVPTPQNVVDEMLKMAGVKEGDVVYDLGCGDGRIVVTAVKQFKAKKGIGIDLNPERVKDSVGNAKKAGVEKQCEFREGDVLKIKDLSEANVITMYLLPQVNRQLAPILKKTLKPGSRIVSHDFDMGDWKPEKEMSVMDEDGVSHMIYLWTIPDDKKK
jgi:uncharacterized protein (TIGR03000 family)